MGINLKKDYSRKLKGWQTKTIDYTYKRINCQLKGQ